ncbi:MAG: universal stress protein [Bacteroidota bacterium]
MENEYPLAKTVVSKKTIFDFARYIGSLTTAKISGVFLERQHGVLQPVLRNMHEIPVVEKITADENAVSRACCGKCQQKNATSLNACHDNEKDIYMATAVTESIIKESRFSDLLILDAEISFDDKQNGILSDVTKAVLTKTECPVMIAPYAFSGIEEIIFAYDGSASAVYAIKQFIYLFPGLADKNIMVVQVNNPGNESITERNNLLGFLQTHFSSIGFHTLSGSASDTLFSYLAGKQHAVVVMGAFGSHDSSGNYRRSTAEPLVKTINLPLFIAHQF